MLKLNCSSESKEVHVIFSQSVSTKPLTSSHTQATRACSHAPSHIHTTHGHIHTRTHMQTRRVRLHAGGHQVQSGSRVDWQARPDRSGEPGHNGSDCQRRCYLQLPRRGRLTAGTPRFPLGGGARYGTWLREWAGGRGWREVAQERIHLWEGEWEDGVPHAGGRSLVSA